MTLRLKIIDFARMVFRVDVETLAVRLKMESGLWAKRSGVKIKMQDALCKQTEHSLSLSHCLVNVHHAAGFKSQVFM